MRNFQADFSGQWLRYLLWNCPHRVSLDHTYDKSTLVQVMARCRQATSHYLSQCWPRSKSPHGITRPQWVNSLAPGICCCNLKLLIFQTFIRDTYFEHFLWNCPLVNATRLHWWLVSIGSGDGLVPSGIKPLPQPMLIYVTLCRHKAIPS